jgi:polyhydroxyalkanoate synthesis regulator phasin
MQMNNGRQVKDVFGEAVAAMNQTIKTFNEQAKELTDRMVEQGKLSRVEGRRLFGELNQQVRLRSLTLENSLSGHVDTLRRRLEGGALKNLNLASKAQLDELKRRVAYLTAEVEKVTGAARQRRKGEPKN